MFRYRRLTAKPTPQSEVEPESGRMRPVTPMVETKQSLHSPLSTRTVNSKTHNDTDLTLVSSHPERHRDVALLPALPLSTRGQHRAWPAFDGLQSFMVLPKVLQVNHSGAACRDGDRESERLGGTESINGGKKVTTPRP